MATRVGNIDQVMTSSPVMELISGPEKGRLFNVEGKRLNIGRAEDNEICISGEGVSRNHAVIEMNPEGRYLIKDNESRNGVQVNGSTIKYHMLQTGDVVRIGNVVFRYSEENPAAGAMNLQPAAESLPAEQVAPGEKKKPKGLNKRVLLYGGVGVVLLVVVLSSQSGEQTATPTEENAGESGEVSVGGTSSAGRIKVTPPPDLNNPNPGAIPPGMEDPTLKNAEQDVSKLEWQNSSLREAEQYFRKGQREYFSQNYQRAIEDFEGALNIHRTHPLAQMYLTRAKSEAEVEARKNMEVAIKYFESLQYSRAIYHFQQVIALLAHRPGEKIIGECEKYIAVAKRRLQASEVFP